MRSNASTLGAGGGLLLALFVVTHSMSHNAALSAETNDGRMRGIVFISSRGDQGTEIYTMLPDGSRQRRLTYNQGIEDQLDVSPDGKWVLYTKYDFRARKIPGHAAPGVWPDILLMDMRGRNSRVLVPYEMGGIFFRDGSGRILLTKSNPNSGSDFYVTDVTGGKPTRILASPHKNSYVVPSPDSSRILFSSSRDLPDARGDDSWLSNYEKYVMNIDGTRVQRLTDNVVPDLAAYFSPDGKRIVFVEDEWLYTMNADGTDKKRILDHKIGRDIATFVDGGSRILFAGALPQGGSDPEIWTIGANGEDLRQLTDNDVYDGVPKAW